MRFSCQARTIAKLPPVEMPAKMRKALDGRNQWFLRNGMKPKMPEGKSHALYIPSRPEKALM